MEVDAKILEAVALLRQAGRMDLLKEGALALGRPARRASAGVAAVVAACSPPRLSGAGKVRGASWGVGAKGVFGAGKGRFSGRGRGSPRASREVGHGIQHRSWNPARKGKAGPQEATQRTGGRIEGVETLEVSASGKPKKEQAGARQVRAAGSSEFQKSVGGTGAFSTSKGLPVTGWGRRGKAGLITRTGQSVAEFSVEAVDPELEDPRLKVRYCPTLKKWLLRDWYIATCLLS
ncbi:hypothetical protein NDU88_006643 [Pleurodeles waltl]|uniref:Uncharacterized protein n=1 Tax=Pleurodeles waltl TaxID=8319 RepID=A0AAV7TZ36_PLEWA|nr:hypothetical protein NDU88_006643 [Pleurodeles waltl]